MLKWLGVLFIIIGCSGMGISMKNDMQRHLKQLKRIIIIFEMLGSETRYYKADLPEACRRVGKRETDDFGQCLENICTRMEKNTGNTFQSVWKEEWLSCLSKTQLNQREKEQVIGFAGEAGCMDPLMQEAEIHKCQKEFEYAAEKLEQEVESKGKVYTSLGVAGGLVLTIILF